MKMPFEKMGAGEARALAERALEATEKVTCDGGLAMVCGLDSDMLPTANVNDARWLVLRFPTDGGKVGVAMVKLSEAGLMTQLAVRG